MLHCTNGARRVKVLGEHESARQMCGTAIIRCILLCKFFIKLLIRLGTAFANEIRNTREPMKKEKAHVSNCVGNRKTAKLSMNTVFFVHQNCQSFRKLVEVIFAVHWIENTSRRWGHHTNRSTICHNCRNDKALYLCRSFRVCNYKSLFLCFVFFYSFHSRFVSIITLNVIIFSLCTRIAQGHHHSVPSQLKASVEAITARF